MCTRRLDSLVALAVMLRHEDVNIDELAKQIPYKKPKIQEIGGSVSVMKREHHEFIKCTTFKKIGGLDEDINMSEKRRKIHHQILVGAVDKIGTWRKPIIKAKKSAKVLDGGRFRGSFVCNSSKTMKKKKQRNTEPIVLSEEMKKLIVDCGGSEESAILVIDKRLSPSDLNPVLCRMSIPYGQISQHFLAKLYPSEKALLKSLYHGIKVTLFVHRGDNVRRSDNGHALKLKSWKSNNMYALVEGWKDICRRYPLKEGEPLHLWSFRRNLDLCLALDLTV